MQDDLTVKNGYALLSRKSNIGGKVWWQTISRKDYYGILIDWDSNVAVVRCMDGEEKSVEC